MPDELVNVRYMVDDVEDAVAFYTTHFGFTLAGSSGRQSIRVSCQSWGTIRVLHL